MDKKSVNICTYSRQFVQNVESILNSTEIVLNKIKEGFDDHYEKFKPFLKCVEEGNLDYYMRKIKAREKGVEINNVDLNEIERFVSDPNKGNLAKEMLKDMENTLNLIKDINFERMKEFLYRSNIIYIFTEFENYLFKCIKFILLKYPAILDEKSIKLKEITLIQNDANLGLVKEIIAENTIHDLFYKNYYEIFKYLNNPLRLELDFSRKVINKLNGYKEIRNLLTHGEGKINLLFQNRIFNWNLSTEDLNLNSLKLGEKIIVDHFLISDFLDILFDIIIEIDIVMVKKFPELRFEMESLDHLFYMTYVKYLTEKWTNVLNED